VSSSPPRAAILNNVRRRYESDIIYTATGPILIAMNPCKTIPGLYSPELSWQYSRWKPGGEELPPHCFTVAEAAYRTTLEESHSSSIVICGESGAGKTETTKLMLQYVSLVASRSGSNSSDSLQGDSLAARIMDSNPILEAFGNAQTNRNHNSSRFGKYLRMYLEDNGELRGASITSYLLEKSRCVAHSSGERNYHIYYQLLAGIKKDDCELGKRLHLQPDPAAYEYLRVSAGGAWGGASRASGVIRVTEAGDLEGWRETQQAFKTLGVGREKREELYFTLAALLHLGNIEFVSAGEADADADAGAGVGVDVGVDVGAAAGIHHKREPISAEGAVARNLEALEYAAELLGVKATSLERALTTRTITTGESVIHTALDPAKVRQEEAHALFLLSSATCAPLTPLNLYQCRQQQREMLWPSQCTPFCLVTSLPPSTSR
jgi:myosin heavy subunit